MDRWRGKELSKMSNEELRDALKECRERIRTFESNPNASLAGRLYEQMKQSESCIQHHIKKKAKV